MTSLKLGKRKGLSQVVTTLIILVVSVMMTTSTLTYYSMTVTSSAIKMEQLTINEFHVWVRARAVVVTKLLGMPNEKILKDTTITVSSAFPTALVIV